MSSFNLIENLNYCQAIVQEVSLLIYYSHLPSAILALLISSFILFKSDFSLLGKILFGIAITFAFWVLFNLSIWVFFYQNNLLMSAWAPIEIFSVLLFILCLYFTYVFIEKKDASFGKKFVALLPLLPIIIITPTHYNLVAYDIQECIAIENSLYVQYTLFIKIFFSLAVIIFVFYKYFKVERAFRKQVLLMAIGITIFLMSFLIAGYIAVLTDMFIYEAAGLGGMVVFIAFLGYIIVQFGTFNIKIIATQALVLSIIFLTAASLFYTRGTIDLLLTLSTLLLIWIAGYFLSGSVKKVVSQKEEIAKLAINLQDANVQLRDLDRQKDELLSIVSHQLATPVSSVKWYLEMLLDGDVGVLSKEQQEYLNTMQSVTYNLADLVSMILDVSRIQLGKMKVDLQPLDLNEFFKEILSVIEPKAQEKQQNFDVHIPKDLPTVMLDKRLTRMTVENLLSNAVKYTPAKGSVAWNVERHGDMLSITVQDTGCGIPEKDQKKIFGKLFRASNTGSIDGNGFGLYVAKGAIEAQGGKIWFESKENDGTTFFVELPLKILPPKV